MKPTVEVIKVDWTEHYQALQNIREQVFINEQNVPRDLEWDGKDPSSTHFLAKDPSGRAIGCARLLPTGQIGRMAVLQDHRGTGIGALLLQAAVDEGQSQGFERLFLHSQSYAEPFYLKGGFLPYGTTFQEADIDHIAMELLLPLVFSNASGLPLNSFVNVDHKNDVSGPTDSDDKAIPAPEAPPLKPSNTYTFSGLIEARQQLLRTIALAKRQLYILSPNLDPVLFDQDSVYASLSELARRAPNVNIRILISDSKPLLERGHSLLQLAMRLDEKINIRVSAEPAGAQTSAYVCADLASYWTLPQYARYDGFAVPNQPAAAHRLRLDFIREWGRSKADVGLRRLTL